MATSAPASRRAATSPPPENSAALTSVVTWIKGIARSRVRSGRCFVVWWWTAVVEWHLEGPTEAVRGALVPGAACAFESRNYPLAGSELSQGSGKLLGHPGRSGGAVLLAIVRMAQARGSRRIDQLKKFAPAAGPHFRAQAYGLLGAAYENAGQYKESGRGVMRRRCRTPNTRSSRRSTCRTRVAAGVAQGDTAKAIMAYVRSYPRWIRRPPRVRR